MTFAEDFTEWEWRLLTMENETPEGVEEIRQCIRKDWKTPELKASWIAHVADEAKHSRELRALGRGLLVNIKSSAERKAA